MRKSILHGFWRGVIAVGLGALLAPVVIHLLVEPISAGDGFFGRSWGWYWDQFYAFLPVLVIPVAIYALLARYLGPRYPRARRAFLREWRFAVATLGRVRLVVVAVLLFLAFYTALIIPLSFRFPVLSWVVGGWQPPRWQTSFQRGSLQVIRFSPAEGPARPINGPFHWVVVDYSSYVAQPMFQTGIGPWPHERIRYLEVRLWAALVAFASYPAIVIIAFLRGPWRRRRRQERGLCVACGYDLAGLIGPRCPECGQPFAVRQRERTPA